MMVLYISVFIFILAYSSFIKKSIFTPLVLFAFCWCIFPVIADMEIAGLYKLSLGTHICIIISISTFIFTYIFLPNNSNQIKNANNYVNTKLLIISNILSWIFLLPYTIQAFEISKAFGLEYLREFSTTEQLITSTQIQVLYNWFLIPLYLVTAIFVCILFVDGKAKNNKSLLLVSIISIILHSITFAARALLVKYMFYFVFALFFCNFKETKIGKKEYFKMFSLILGLLIVTVFIGQGRSSRSFFESFIIYYAGAFSLFDYYITHPQISYLVDSPYLFGTALFGFIYNIFQSVKYIIFGTNYLGSDYIITQFTAQAFPIGENIYINAATTAMYPFMRDLGYAGLIIGFLFMALLIRWIENKVKNKPSYRNKAVFIVLLYVIFKLSMSYEMLGPSVIFMILYIIIATKKFKIIYK